MKSNHLIPPPHEAVAHAHGFDRIKIATDRAVLPEPIDKLNFLCAGGADFDVRNLKFNPAWKATLDLRQPAPEAISELRSGYLADQVGAMITYIEVAWDIIFKTQRQAREFQTWLLERLSLCYQRGAIHVFECTVYFSRRAGATSGKRGVVGVTYCDRPSKIVSPHFERPCVHVEIRLTGSDVAARAGIASVSDLVHFDHAEFWKRAIRLHECPPPTRLGRLLGGHDMPSVSGTALRKRAHKFVEGCSLDGQFFMHNARRANQRVAKHFARIPLSSVMPIAGDVH